MNTFIYSQEQNQALFNEYLHSLVNCFSVYGGNKLMKHYLGKLHDTLTAEFPTGAMISGWQADSIRELFKQVESGNSYPYSGKVLDGLNDLYDYFPPKYTSTWGDNNYGVTGVVKGTAYGMVGASSLTKPKGSVSGTANGAIGSSSLTRPKGSVSGTARGAMGTPLTKPTSLAKPTWVVKEDRTTLPKPIL